MARICGRFSLLVNICRIVNNRDWYDSISSLELIGHFGRYFRVTEMLGRQSVKSRIDTGEGISFTEFSYQLFQGYDWYHLHKNYGCNIQVGGHDQMGNMVSGHDLISRALKKQVYGKCRLTKNPVVFRFSNRVSFTFNWYSCRYNVTTN